MRILSNEEVDDVLKRLVALQITLNEEHMNEESFASATDNIANIIWAVGGSDGLTKCMNTLAQRKAMKDGIWMDKITS